MPLPRKHFLLRWQHPSADGVISFKSADVSSLVIAQKPRPPGARLHNSAVGLINGDRLLGDLIELTPELLVLDTWYGGRLTLPRSAVAELNPVLMGSRVVFQSREGDDSGLRGRLHAARGNRWSGRATAAGVESGDV